ncbi:MAG TPA: T9SS type A sorting domain-containing protein, partial [Bacteroidia bacterium]|nr:T9SS type A sorting domain-containing protein [Bacteroidia bacterium]
ANTIRVRLQAKKAGNVRLEIMDLTGRVVTRMNQYVGQGLTIQHLDATQLPAGTYIIRAEQNGVVGTGKVVKL